MSILIVDDDRDIREALAEALQLEGYETEGVADGREALEYLKGGNSVCAILLDLMMPGMNGWEFRDKQRADPELASIPVIVISADGNAAEKAKRLSVDDYLCKPASAEDLVSVVAKYCGAPGSSNSTSN